MIKKLVLSLLPLWVIGCNTTRQENIAPDYKAIGDSLSQHTFQKLSGTLKEKIASSGFPGAVVYCNTEAEKITNSLAGETISIERTSLKPRNERNSPDSIEKEILDYFQEKFSNGDSLAPILKTDKAGNTHYFKPIMLQPLCLGCHGVPEKEIAIPTMQAIASKYPNDPATGYQAGDLRGAWHIIFSKK